MSDSEVTLVVFRVWTGKSRLSLSQGIEIFALFPTVHADNHGYYCSSYSTIGQHTGADYHHCINQSRPAKPEEYTDLKAELERRGYTLRVIQRATRQHHEKRRAIVTALTVANCKHNTDWLYTLAGKPYCERCLKLKEEIEQEAALTTGAT